MPKGSDLLTDWQTDRLTDKAREWSDLGVVKFTMKRTRSHVYSESSKREIMQGFRILVTHRGDVWSLFGLLLFPLSTSSIVPFCTLYAAGKSSLNKWTSYGAICVRTLFGLWSNRNKLWTAFKECQEKCLIFFASFKRTTGIHVVQKI